MTDKPQMLLLISVKSNYGTPVCYPENEQAKLFAEMVGMKTLPHRVLCLAERLGFTIEQTTALSWRRASQADHYSLVGSHKAV